VGSRNRLPSLFSSKKKLSLGCLSQIRLRYPYVHDPQSNFESPQIFIALCYKYQGYIELHLGKNGERLYSSLGDRAFFVKFLGSKIGFPDLSMGI